MLCFSVTFDEVKSYSDGMYTETEDEGFMASPNKSTINVGWLVGSSHNNNSGKSPHIDIYETGQVKPPPYLNVKEAEGSVEAVVIPNFGYNLSRSKSVCDLSMEQNSQLLKNSEKSFTINKKKVIEKRPSNNGHNYQRQKSDNHQRQKSDDFQGGSENTSTTAAHEQAHRSRIVRNRTILGSFPLFYKLSQSLSSLNTKSEVSATNGNSANNNNECGAYFHQNDSDSSDR